MSDKRILIADADVEVLEGFRQTLSQQWTITAATGGNAAFAEMKKEPCDVVVADLSLPEIDGAELLSRIRKEFPKTILFILATEPDKERVMKNVLGAHQFLTKPCDPATLKSAIERALALDVWVASNNMRELIARVRTLPTVPSLYFEVLAALRSPDASTEQVGAIIAKDMAMMTKLLQVLNSAYFGLSRKISDPVEAVGILGFDAVKSMVMALKLLSQYDKVKPIYFSIDRLWRHSTQVARSARQLVLNYTSDRTMAETAFTAGLMHDLGKIVLASNFDEQYRGVQSLAIKQQLPLWEVEKEIFGANHGEIGAYLLGLWGMPLDLLEASALHHTPSLTITKGFTPLTAVHVANVFEHEANPAKDGLVAPKIDEAYLKELGLFDRLDAWRGTLVKGEPVKPEPGAKPAKSSAPKPAATAHGNGSTPATKPKPAAKPLLPAITTSQPQGKHAPSAGQGRWLYASAVIAALVVFGWLIIGSLSNLTSKHPSGQPEVAASDAPQIVHARSAVDVAAGSSANDKPNAATSPASAASQVKAGPRELSVSDFKLQGIFYSADQPSAIINGRMVHPNDRLSGARIVQISPSTVTFEYQNQRKTLVLK